MDRQEYAQFVETVNISKESASGFTPLSFYIYGSFVIR
jgi:hypothetical protein